MAHHVLSFLKGKVSAEHRDSDFEMVREDQVEGGSASVNKDPHFLKGKGTDIETYNELKVLYRPLAGIRIGKLTCEISRMDSKEKLYSVRGRGVQKESCEQHYT